MIPFVRHPLAVTIDFAVQCKTIHTFVGVVEMVEFVKHIILVRHNQ